MLQRKNTTHYMSGIFYCIGKWIIPPKEVQPVLIGTEIVHNMLLPSE